MSVKRIIRLPPETGTASELPPGWKLGEDGERKYPSRDKQMRPLCPNCGNIVGQSEKADFCGSCGYECHYP